ncbi:MAG: hypothetical protein FJ358_03410 [Thaumarchaeota archaeon]|nr:hypothetical protein [Nitrososphaerota archaeon]
MAGSTKNYLSSIQLVGLGGTGVNTIEAFIKNRRGLVPLLKKEGIRVSMLALDVADHDIRSLEGAYKDLKDEMKLQGIPAEKIDLVAKTVKFPTPESMFDFISRYPEYLEREGARKPRDYAPWLSSSMEIPPLAGGVGRKRALSKAIYGLNYYHLKLVENYMDSFKEHVFSSTIQPVIFVIYGIGGGTGSGIIPDFVRHLRHKVGSGVPIIGMAILPCGGDDPPAKGSASYASLLEHELLIDRAKNTFVTQNYGETYENPFTALLMMPLGPAYSKTGSVVDARRLIDDAMVDILMKSLNFDLADLFNNIGSNVDLAGNWVHIISTLKVSYPVAEFIDITKIYLKKLDRIRDLRKEKKEVWAGVAQDGNGGIYGIMKANFEELTSIYKQILIAKNTFDEKTFEKDRANFIAEGKSIESDLIMHLKGVEESIRIQVSELAKAVLSIGMDAPDGTIEARIRNLVGNVVDMASATSKNYQKFQASAKDVVEDLRGSLPSAQQLTHRQSQILNDTIDFTELLEGYITGLRLYLDTSAFADKLAKYLGRAEKTEANQELLRRVQKIVNPELVVLFALLSSLFTPMSSEIKTVDVRLSDSRLIRRVLAESVEKTKAHLETLEMKRRSREGEKDRIDKDLSKLRFGFISGGKRKYLETKSKEFEHEIRLITLEIEAINSELIRIQTKLNEYLAVEKKFDVNAELRKVIAEITELNNVYYDKLNQVMKDRGYYDKVAELTETEQLKIMQRILSEEETSLTNENILKEIIDRKHLRDYLVSALGIFRIPATLGLTAEYRTDYLWVTVVSPRGIWDKDLDSDVKTILSGYIRQDASKTIYIREVDSDDPWTLRFLIIAAKAKVTMLEAYKEMKSIYEQSAPSERVLSHSFLLEQGVHVIEAGKLALNSVFEKAAQAKELKE